MTAPLDRGENTMWVCFPRACLGGWWTPFQLWIVPILEPSSSWLGLAIGRDLVCVYVIQFITNVLHNLCIIFKMGGCDEQNICRLEFLIGICMNGHMVGILIDLSIPIEFSHSLECTGSRISAHSMNNQYNMKCVCNLLDIIYNKWVRAVIDLFPSPPRPVGLIDE